MVPRRQFESSAILAVCLVIATGWTAAGQTPPTLDIVFPAGGQAGQVVEVTVGGNLGQPGLALQGSVAGLRCETLEPARFRLTIPSDTPPGMYDLWAASEQGISGPRQFFVGNRAEQLEAEPNETLSTAMQVALNAVVNGRLDRPSDFDCFRFEAKRGQRVIVECWAERIDSRLRAVLELFDEQGRRLAVNRGYYGIDPLLDFPVPADGRYVVKIHDLTAGGSAEHYYRLDIDTGPRVAFCVPSVVEQGKAARIAVYGWNLGDARDAETGPVGSFDRVEVELPASLAQPSWPLPVRSGPASAVTAGFAYHFPGSHASVVLGISDVPVLRDRSDNHEPGTAQSIVAPCEVSGQLSEAGEQDWYAIDVRRGEVFYLEGLAQRLGSPVDLELSVLAPAGTRELARFTDEVRNIGGSAFPTSHLDPTGRWVAPQDGRFLIVVRNLAGGTETDLRRVYRLSLRREEPAFQLVAVPRSGGPSAVNVRRGGREPVDVLVFRQRGCDGPIRITARNLPVGVDCADVCLGPGVDRGLIVVSADRKASNLVSDLTLEAFQEEVGCGSQASRTTTAANTENTDLRAEQRRPVRGGTVVRSRIPGGWARLTSRIPLAVAGDAPLRITADAHEPLKHHLYGTLQVRHSPGGILDVAVEVEQPEAQHQAPVKLLGEGLPAGLENQTAVLAPGQTKGYLSFCLPPTLSPGRYSLVIRAETTTPNPAKPTETMNVTAYSNSVTFDVQPEAFIVEVDPFAPTQARRGETLQVRYSAQRRNGFIGKMHTELAAPGRVTDVPGLRGRGETFVGQTETGSLQIMINDDAPLGSQPFLRLFTVGVVEDQPVYFGGSLFPLEIVK